MFRSSLFAAVFLGMRILQYLRLGKYVQFLKFRTAGKWVCVSGVRSDQDDSLCGRFKLNVVFLVHSFGIHLLCLCSGTLPKTAIDREQ